MPPGRDQAVFLHVGQPAAMKACLEQNTGEPVGRLSAGRGSPWRLIDTHYCAAAALAAAQSRAQRHVPARRLARFWLVEADGLVSRVKPGDEGHIGIFSQALRVLGPASSNQRWNAFLQMRGSR